MIVLMQSSISNRVNRYLEIGIKKVIPSSVNNLTEIELDSRIRKLNSDNTVIRMINSNIFTICVCVLSYLASYISLLIAGVIVIAAIYYFDSLLRINYYHIYYNNTCVLAKPDKAKKAITDDLVTKLYWNQYNEFKREFKSHSS